MNDYNEELFLMGVLLCIGVVIGIPISICLVNTNNSFSSDSNNIKLCNANITITHTDKGYFLPYYIVYSKNHSYHILNENKWIYTQMNRNIGDTIEIKYKSYYDDQGNEIREIINIKSNWNDNCNNKKSCEEE